MCVTTSDLSVNLNLEIYELHSQTIATSFAWLFAFRKMQPYLLTIHEPDTHTHTHIHII